MFNINSCFKSVLTILFLSVYIVNAHPQKQKAAHQSGISFDSTVFSNPSVIASYIDGTGKQVVVVNVPGVLPGKYKVPGAQPSDAAVMLTNVPAYDWSFGCSATAAAMMAGYYDNHGYPGIYTGPANGGVAPMNNSIWGSATINGEVRSLCPLSATRQGLDGRATRGHVDDYWISAGSSAPDPFIGNWPQHEYGDCTADFMKTNQSEYGNSDGSTIYAFYVDGSPFTGTEGADGNFGLRLFFESREVEVFGYFNQYISGYNGNLSGFTFEQYKQQIDAGRPVIIQLAGHSVLGVGYDDTGQKVYVHNTWDYGVSELTWGGIYADMQHYAVSVIELVPMANTILTIDPANFIADWNEGSASFSVISNKNWIVSDDADWLILAPETGIGNGNFTALFEENPQIQSRTAQITVSVSTAKDGERLSGAGKSGKFEPLLYEDFSGNMIPEGWEVQGPGQANWYIENSASAGAPPPCLRFNWEPSFIGTSRIATSIINTAGISSMTLMFKHAAGVYSNSFNIGVAVSQDGGNTWQPIWTVTLNAGIGPETVTLPITIDQADTQQFRLSFFFEGNTWDLWDWNIDNILLAENKSSETITLVQEPHPAANQMIPVNAGWSGISTFLNPANPAIEQILAGIEDQLIILKDFEGNTYQPEAKGNIINWDCTKGYFVKMASADDLEMIGLETSGNQVIIEEGWNLIPVYSDVPVDIETYFSDHSDKIEIITEVAGLKVFWPEKEISTLTQLTPGKAYLLKASETFTFSR